MWEWCADQMSCQWIFHNRNAFSARMNKINTIFLTPAICLLLVLGNKVRKKPQMCCKKKCQLRNNNWTLLWERASLHNFQFSLTLNLLMWLLKWIKAHWKLPPSLHWAVWEGAVTPVWCAWLSALALSQHAGSNWLQLASTLSSAHTHGLKAPLLQMHNLWDFNKGKGSLLWTKRRGNWREPADLSGGKCSGF